MRYAEADGWRRMTLSLRLCVRAVCDSIAGSMSYFPRLGRTRVHASTVSVDSICACAPCAVGEADDLCDVIFCVCTHAREP